MTVAGVDEAGRGCVIGPLVVACALFNESKIDDLRLIGVRDSKQLSPKRREVLAIETKALAVKWAFFDLQPWAIDLVVERAQKYRKLNYLEAMAMAKVIRDLHPDKVYIDPADVDPSRFQDQILRVLPWRPEVVCESHADAKFPVVSAASILAKVRRDRIVGELREKYGDFGSGYPSDWKTVSFLESWFRENNSCPPFIRGSWKTVKRIRARVA